MEKTKEKLEVAFYRELDYANDYSKKQAQSQGISLANYIKEQGNEKVIENTSKLARFAEVINSAFSELKSHLVIDKETEHNGVKFQKVNGGEVFDYSHDFVWQDYQNKIDELKALQGLREKKMKQAYVVSQKLPKQELQEDGEIIEPAKIKSYRKSYIKITF